MCVRERKREREKERKREREKERKREIECNNYFSLHDSVHDN